MCGKNIPTLLFDGIKSGSPPRVRGKLWDDESADPAPLAHPRVCGENNTFLNALPRRVGSPPRVRGKLGGPDVGDGPAGLTPACAGKTPRMRAASRAAAAHPRVCGENVLWRSPPPGRAGSPPRVRGKLPSLSTWTRIVGLTPACAGKTDECVEVGGEVGAHPRVCGENTIRLRIEWVNRGSPPRVRGKHGLECAAHCAFRLTPACAGKTCCGGRPLQGGPAHPRVCGENRDDWARRSARSGSPPRVRGKRGLREDFFLGTRLTPACAGKTRTCSSGNAGSAAHPRVCGENVLDDLGRRGVAGSPPRVRGKRRPRDGSR